MYPAVETRLLKRNTRGQTHTHTHSEGTRRRGRGERVVKSGRGEGREGGRVKMARVATPIDPGRAPDGAS